MTVLGPRWSRCAEANERDPLRLWLGARCSTFGTRPSGMRITTSCARTFAPRSMRPRPRLSATDVRLPIIGSQANTMASGASALCTWTAPGESSSAFPLPMLIGRHLRGARSVYARLYRLLEIDEPPDERKKPPCCDDGGVAPRDPEVVDRIVAAAKRLRRAS